MQIIVAAAYWLLPYNDGLMCIAGSFCVLKSPAHLTIHMSLARTPSHGCRGEIFIYYLPIGPPSTLLASPVLGGSINPLLAVGEILSIPEWVESAVGPLTGLGLEPEATWFLTTGSNCDPLDVIVVGTLMLLPLSWISVTSDALVAARLLAGLIFGPWMEPTEKSSWNGNATF
jgi:hypothetical protein